MHPNTGKKRLLLLRTLLYEKTDEQHALSLPEIMGFLAQNGVPADRKTVRADISLLQETGADIIINRGKQATCHIGARSFQLPELKLLIDAVAASKLLTQRKSEELIDTLVSFASKFEAEQLHRYAYTAGRPKSTNESVLYAVDAIHEAIQLGRKIRFQYIDYLPDKQKALKHEGLVYQFSPYAMLWNDDRHYALGYSERHACIVSFRVDRMAGVVLSEDAAIPAPPGFSASEYATQTFDMFAGPECEMTLLCKNELMRVIVDRFGEDVQTGIADEQHFSATVQVAASPTLCAWLLQFGGDISILSPVHAADAYTALCQAAIHAQKTLG